MNEWNIVCLNYKFERYIVPMLNFIFFKEVNSYLRKP